MSDTTLNQFIARGTAAQMAAFTPSPPTVASGPNSGYFWFQTDTGNTYSWNGSAWQQVNTAASAYNEIQDESSIVGAGNTIINFTGAGVTATNAGAGVTAVTIPGGGGGGITTISSGALPAAATKEITSIPATYAYLILQVTGASSDTTTRQPLVRVSVDNTNYDSTSTNYVGQRVTGTTLAAFSTAALASLVDGTTVTNAQTSTFVVQIFGYQGGPNMRWTYRVLNNAQETQGWGTYIGSTTAINALQILWNASGSFDAGTYALYGVS